MGQVAPDAPEPDNPNPAPYVPNAAEAALIAALRSGKYEQTKGCLHNDEGYCCLGVAEDVLNPAAWVQEATGRNWVKEKGAATYYLTKPTQALLGWSDSSGALVGTGFYGECLASLNDDGTPFSKIADLIEQGKVERA